MVHLPTTEADKITDYGMPLSKDNAQVTGNETIFKIGSAIIILNVLIQNNK